MPRGRGRGAPRWFRPRDALIDCVIKLAQRDIDWPDGVTRDDRIDGLDPDRILALSAAINEPPSAYVSSR